MKSKLRHKNIRVFIFIFCFLFFFFSRFSCKMVDKNQKQKTSFLVFGFWFLLKIISKKVARFLKIFPTKKKKKKKHFCFSIFLLPSGARNRKKHKNDHFCFLFLAPIWMGLRLTKTKNKKQKRKYLVTLGNSNRMDLLKVPKTRCCFCWLLLAPFGWQKTKTKKREWSEVCAHKFSYLTLVLCFFNKIFLV